MSIKIVAASTTKNLKLQNQNAELKLLINAKKWKHKIVYYQSCASS